MPEYCLQSDKEKSIGTVRDVLDAIVEHFPGSEKHETERLVEVRFKGNHIADVWAHSPSSEIETAGENVSDAPVTWFNVLGDEDSELYDFLMSKYDVEEMDM